MLLLVVWYAPLRWHFVKQSLTLPEELFEMADEKEELKKAIVHMNYQRSYFDKHPVPIPEVSKIIAKQEVVEVEREVDDSDFGMPIVRIFRMKDHDKLPREFETEIPDKILIEGDSVIYVFRVRPWLRRVR
jgi:hypothetical protein